MEEKRKALRLYSDAAEQPSFIAQPGKRLAIFSFFNLCNFFILVFMQFLIFVSLNHLSNCRTTFANQYGLSAAHSLLNLHYFNGVHVTKGLSLCT